VPRSDEVEVTQLPGNAFVIHVGGLNVLVVNGRKVHSYSTADDGSRDDVVQAIDRACYWCGAPAGDPCRTVTATGEPGQSLWGSFHFLRREDYSAVLDVGCADCGAVVGALCVAKNGKRQTWWHPARKLAAQH
jgi:hypothetical protein